MGCAINKERFACSATAVGQANKLGPPPPHGQGAGQIDPDTVVGMRAGLMKGEGLNMGVFYISRQVGWRWWARGGRAGVGVGTKGAVRQASANPIQEMVWCVPLCIYVCSLDGGEHTHTHICIHTLTHIRIRIHTQAMRACESGRPKMV